MSESAKAIIERWIVKEPKLALNNYTELARLIIEEEGVPYQLEYLRQQIGRLVRLPQNQLKLKGLVAAEAEWVNEEQPKQEQKAYHSGDTVDPEQLGEKAKITEDSYNRKFLVTSDLERYIIEVKGENKSFLISFIDQLFLEYSEHGYNHSSTQVMNEHDLDPATWFAITRAFRLYKKSHVFSPYTWDATPPAQREAMVQDAIEKVMSSGKVTEMVYKKTLYSKYKREVKKSHLVTANHHAFLAELAESLPLAKSSTIFRYTAPNTILQRGEIMVAVTDLHIGAFVMALPGMPDFTLEIIRKRLRALATWINSLGAARVKLAFLGDSIESFMGNNHPNSWQGMEQGLFGAKVVTVAYEVILEFLEQIVNLVEVAAVGGNHDRATGSGKEDTRAEIANILFYFIGAHLDKTGIKVNYDNDTVSTTLGKGLNAILQHGHNGNSRGPATNVLWKHGIKGKFNFILKGHLHSRITANNDDGGDFRRITCPSIFTGNDYSSKAGFSPSLAGAIAIEEDIDGLPFVLDKSLN